MFAMVLVGCGILLGTYMRYQRKKSRYELLMGILVSVYVIGYGVMAYFIPYLNESFMLYALPLICFFTATWFHRRREIKK